MWNELYPMRAIADMSCIWHRVLEREMADLGLSSIQSRMLGYIYFQNRQKRQVFQRELEEVFKIRKSSVTSVLQTLERKGYLAREQMSGDARQKVLVITDHGIEMQTTIMNRLDALEHMVLEVLRPEDLQALFSCMEKIETRLKEAEHD